MKIKITKKMKQTLIIISLMLFVTELCAQQNSNLYKKMSDSLPAYTKLFHKKYRHYSYGMNFDMTDTLMKNIDHEDSDFNIEIPDISSNKALSNKLYKLLDSLAQTDIYSNKLLAYNGYNKLLRKMRPYPQNWQKELSKKIASSILDKHLRIIGLDAICDLPRSAFTHDLLKKIADVYTPPTLTREEAEVSAQLGGNTHVLKDTIGYSKLKEIPENKLSSKEENRLWNMKVDLYRADKANMSLKAYYDSLNRESFKKRVKYRRNYSFAGGGSIVQCLARKKVYKAAPMIDTLKDIPRFDDWDHNFSLDLARLRYKDYPEKMIKKYGHAIDTTIQYLESGNFSKEKNDDIQNQLDTYFRSLTYIGTQEAYYKTAPLVSIKDTILYPYRSDYKPYRIGTLFIDIMSEYIKNMPTYAMDSINGDVWYIDKKLPEGYHEKIYNWMIENKGNYEIERYYE